MTTPLQTIIAALMAGAIVAIALGLWAAAGQIKQLQRRLADQTPTWRLPAPTPTAGPRWHALPGQRIELGATGWAIVMDLRPGTPLYRLDTPEGAGFAVASELALLKAMAERLAAERAEFEPHMHPAGCAAALCKAGAAPVRTRG